MPADYVSKCSSLNSYWESYIGNVLSKASRLEGIFNPLLYGFLIAVFFSKSCSCRGDECGFGEIILIITALL